MRMPGLDDTIIAVSTGWQASPLGILRLSGKAAFTLLGEVGEALSETDLSEKNGWRESILTLPDDLKFPATVYWFRGPHSYTGQNIVELHTLGSMPLLRALSAHLIGLGARRALPGEFTARAYLNGRLDADHVEGVLELIHAQDRDDARRAARFRRDRYHASITKLRRELTELISLVEAGIDFVEEEDIHFITPAELLRAVSKLNRTIALLGGADRQLARAGQPHIALAGLPNAGKSTLFNALIGTERAIVTPILGTTRDVLSAELDLGGVSVVLQDTAGLGPGMDELESAAHIAAEEAANQADVVVWVHESGKPWSERESRVCRRISESRRVLVLSKSDLASADATTPPADLFHHQVSVSVTDDPGLSELRGMLARSLEVRGQLSAGAPTPANVESLAAFLGRVTDMASRMGDRLDLPELIALELRGAWDLLAEVDRGPLVEDILENILSRFCIGK